ncbi:MAG: GH1 family beta-glucosidase [Ilumatobacter sp.]|uniref:GH1 family beta-glucosidase n=1 Tax=Ilumatobacter sp. TaxID=1967498 RepID=UPI002630B6A5|nr:GH1 family beta-glucosidase [Ilumatobacter sp.]MDJ0769643.1 GH1 family beta-glucosidase [Ilumatobacter sp.]
MDERPSVDFPDGFLWGAATAAYQIEGAVAEGGRGPSVWDDYSHTPGRTANGDTGDVACDHYHRLESDVALMAELGLRSYRFSISWSRVLPEGRGRVNAEGLAFYHRLTELLLAHDIVPNATLFHWDLPSALEATGGFRNRDTAKWFSDYAALMVRELGDRVSMWATFNEPWCYAYLGHAAAMHAPGLTDDAAAVAVAHHELLAHGLGVEAMRAERSDLELGIVLNPSGIVAEGSPAAPEDSIRSIDGLHNRWWFDGVLNGAYPADVLDDLGPLGAVIEPGDMEQIVQPIDWMGINYYFEILVRGLPADGSARALRQYPTVASIAESPTRPVHTDMGWPITPEGFTAFLQRLHREYPDLPPIYITENGAAYDDPVVDGRCADPRRIDYLDRHLRALRDAIDSGVDVRGYYQWSLFDNFEWALGFDKRFGIVHVDFDTLERTPKDSAHWYRDVIKANALPARAG